MDRWKEFEGEGRTADAIEAAVPLAVNQCQNPHVNIDGIAEPKPRGDSFGM
jgi:hypothetical protein